MTPNQLKKLEADLEKRGYKKWTTCLIGREDYAWFKSFGEHKDKYGDTEIDYQIAFRIYDWRGKYPDFNPPKQSEIWLTVSMIPTSIESKGRRYDSDFSMQLEVPDIEMCEAMNREIYETVKRYIKKMI